MRNCVRHMVMAATALSLGFTSFSSWADRDTERKIEKAIVIADILFGDHEKEVFGEYLEERVKYSDNSRAKKKKSLPPGLQKKLARGGDLPPGWQKKVARGEVIDQDLLRHGHRLPVEILRRLPIQPEGTSLMRIDNRIVRIIDATHTIMDVFHLH